MPKLFKVDIHTHILPEKWPDLRERYGYGGFIRLEHYKPCCARMMLDNKFFREVQDNLWDPGKRIEECDHQQVDVQVLSTVPVMFNYWAKPKHTHDLSQLLNDHIAQVVDDYPDRFIGLGTLPMQAPKLAVTELERCMNHLGLRGIQIGSHINTWNLNNARLFPVYEAAEALGAAIFVHPWDMMGQDQMPKYWLPWLVGMPAETARAMCSLIFGGVFEKFPKLRVAFAHGGGSFPATIGRIAHGFEVRPDLCAVDNPVNPREYLNKFYVDSLVHDPDNLRFLIDLIGIDRVALGTDYPFPLGEAKPGSLIEALNISEADKKKLLGSNAMDWLGVKTESFVK
jgi:aminocarboxymuconate-semialdehyde decarboxylase